MLEQCQNLIDSITVMYFKTPMNYLALPSSLCIRLIVLGRHLIIILMFRNLFQITSFYVFNAVVNK